MQLGVSAGADNIQSVFQGMLPAVISGFIAFATLIALGNVALVVLMVRRRRSAAASGAALGGVTTMVDPLAAVAFPGTQPSLVVVGGCNIPTAYLRMNATWPLARFELTRGRVALNLRVRMFGGKPLYAWPADLASVFPVKSWLGSRGIGFRLPDGREWYFWTSEGERILAALAGAGFPVSRVPERARKIYRAEP